MYEIVRKYELEGSNVWKITNRHLRKHKAREVGQSRHP